MQFYAEKHRAAEGRNPQCAIHEMRGLECAKHGVMAKLFGKSIVKDISIMNEKTMASTLAMTSNLIAMAFNPMEKQYLKESAGCPTF